jgi:hypothetical protein
MKTTVITSLILASSTVLAVAATPAQAVTFKFQNIFPATSPSELSGDPFVNNFSFDVTDAGSGKILFQINNTGTIGAIGQVFFENTGNLLSNFALNVNNTGTVSFRNISPGNLSQGNKISFEEAFGGQFQGRGGGGANRINEGEKLGITFDGNFNNVISALQSEDLRVGIHVQELPQGQSDSFVSDGGKAEVPEPLTILGTSAAFGFGVLFKKKGAQMQKKSKNQ